MRRPDWAPESIDIARPSVARMYDYYLGGSHNFAVDRAAAQAMIAAIPEAPLIAQANRAFLRRTVRFLVDAGIRQFLDIGSGIPTVGNVHELAPEATVVYVDVDPVAVAHGREILNDIDRAVAIQEDIRNAPGILDHPDVRKLIDFDQPLGLMIVAVMHFVPDEDRPADIVATLRRALAPGSYLVLSHACDDGRTDEEQARATEIYRNTDSPLALRGSTDIARLFDGFALVEPGLVWAPQWRPDSPDSVEAAEWAVYLGGVGRLA